MKKITCIFMMSLIISCSSKNHFAPNFVYSVKSYDKNNVERSEFYYNSTSGILKKDRPEINIIKLSNQDKRNIYSFYKKLKLKSNKCRFVVDDYSNEYFLEIERVTSNTIKCDSTDNEERIKNAKLFIRIYETIQSQKEYRKVFPGEFEVY